jgi:hypothetical protein
MGTKRSATISGFFLLPLAVAIISVPAGATTLVHMSLEQLSQASTDIVRGHVVYQESSWDAFHKLMLTVTQVAIEQRMKGQAPELIEIEQPGGKIGNVRLYVPGTVHFLPGAKYLLFVEPARTAPSRYLVVGMTQGAYRIYQDAAIGEERVLRPLGRMFYGPGTASSQTESLRLFRQELSSAIAAPMIIPGGTVMLITVETTEMSGVGRLEVQGRTARDLFPGERIVVPAGSLVEGTAQEKSGAWQIRWSDVIVRGRRIPIFATGNEAMGALRGKTLVVRVQ